MTCPNCGSGRVRLSSTAKPADELEAARGNAALRCRDCGRRFYFPIEEAEREPLQKAVKVHVDRPRSKIIFRRRLLQAAFSIAALLAAAVLAKIIVEYTFE